MRHSFLQMAFTKTSRACVRTSRISSVVLPYKHQRSMLCIGNGSAVWIKCTTGNEWTTENGRAQITRLTEDVIDR